METQRRDIFVCVTGVASGNFESIFRLDKRWYSKGVMWFESYSLVIALGKKLKNHPSIVEKMLQ